MVKMWNNGRQHPPKLKLLLVLEQSSNWGLVDQELHQCLPLVGTLCTAYYSSRMYLWKVGTYLRFWKMGHICFSSLGLERFVGLNNLHRNIPCYLFKFPTRIFARIFKRGSGFAMVLSSRSKCMILTYGRDVWPCSSYLYSWYVEFMDSKMYAYLGYLYCLAEG